MKPQSTGEATRVALAWFDLAGESGAGRGAPRMSVRPIFQSASRSIDGEKHVGEAYGVENIRCRAHLVSNAMYRLYRLRVYRRYTVEPELAAQISR